MLLFYEAFIKSIIIIRFILSDKQCVWNIVIIIVATDSFFLFYELV